MAKISKTRARNSPTALRVVVFLTVGVVAGSLTGAYSNAAEWRQPEPIRSNESPQWFNAPLPWARPLSDGRIDALLLAPWDALRDAVELETRIELRLVRVGYCDTETGADAEKSEGNAPGEALLDALLDAGPDVVILGNVDLANLPSDFLDELVSRVEGGLGLIVYRFARDRPPAFEALFDSVNRLEDNAEITRGLGSRFVPAWRDGFDFVDLYEYGAGRVADIAYESGAPSMHALVPAPDGPGDYSEILAFEDHMSLAARAVVWSARRKPDARIERVTVQLPADPLEDQIPPFLPREFIRSLSDASLPQGLVPFRIDLDQPATRAYDLAYSLRFPSRALSLPEIPGKRIAKGRSSATIHVPAGQGEFLLDVWLRDKKGVVDWFTANASLRGWPEIFDVQFSKHALRENDELTVMLQIRPLYNRPRQSTVLFRAVDGWGRVVAERYVSVGPEAGPVSALLSFSDLISPFLRVDVFAADMPRGPFGPLALAKSAHVFMVLPVHLRTQAAFGFVAAGSGSFERNARGQNIALARQGVDTISMSTASTSAIAPVVDNLRIAPRVAEYSHANMDGSFCLTDAEFLRNERDRIHDLSLSYGALGSTTYALGSSCGVSTVSTTRVCQSETCSVGFEAMLRNSFASLNALNQTWGTRYARWDAVRASGGVPDEGEPLSHWLDSRLYLDRVILNAHTRALAVIRGADPESDVAAIVGNTPPRSPGPAWHQLASHMDMVAAPNSTVAVEKLRSYASGETRTMLGIDGGGGARAGLPWRALLNGFDGVRLVRAESAAPCPSVASGALGPDSRPRRWFERVAAEVAEVRSGYGLLFAKATREPADIAVYDNRASHHVNSLRSVRGASSEDSEAALALALNELGYAFDFVSSEDALAGGLDHYRTLVLPMVSVLSDRELAVLSEFASGGKLVVADVLPGAYGEHGTPRANPPLSQLFRAAEPVEGLEPAWIIQRGSGFFGAMLGEPFPALNSVEELASELERLLADSGSVKAGETLPLEAEGLRGARTAYRYGNARILAFTNVDDGKSNERKIRVDLGREMFAYASRRGELVRGGKRYSFRLRPGEVELIAFLPYEVTRLVLDVPEAVRQGRRLHVGIGIRTREKLPGNHVVHVSLATRLGEPIPYYSRSLECEAGQGLASIPLALNETPGEYTVTVRDAMTGFVETAPVDVIR